MKLLIEKGRVIDPASGRDERADIAIAAGRIVSSGSARPDFNADQASQDCTTGRDLLP